MLIIFLIILILKAYPAVKPGGSNQQDKAIKPEIPLFVKIYFNQLAG